ncbi:MAG: ThiF family adenylyltransferase, partial [Taibaiella sp.]|nr:ThiF family adenylyltransferase [Taibaiella sp.]
IIAGYDIVVDCTDNFDTRYLLNDACVLAGKPLVYGAIYQYEGQVAVWNIHNENGTLSPNYRDLYPEVNAAVVPNCADGGVIPTIAGMIGCLQANEVIKYITGTGELLAGKLLMMDAFTMQHRLIKLGTTTKTKITSLPAVYVREITAGELKEHVDEYQLIDVRTEEEHSLYNIGGLHIPLHDIGTADIAIDKPIVCYCASGRRSAGAARILLEKYSGASVYSLRGGLDAWPVEYHG